MKELSIEEKAERYDKVSKEVKDFFEGRQKMPSDVTQTLEYLFPELSKDERIRKSLHSIINDIGGNVLHQYLLTKDEVLTWLEKQGEQKFANKFHEGDYIVNDYCMGRIVRIANDTYRLDTGVEIPFSCHSTRLWDITKDAKDGDVLSYRNGQWIFIFKRIDKYYALWSTIDNDLTIYGSISSLLTNSIYPATKEQRDQLERAMTNVGYRWNKEKLKLEEI